MASCLLECLCEADLEQYYPHFVAHGLQKIEELAKVTMRDYSKLGVHSMEDRKRLFQLIKIIQSVAAEESNDGQTPPLQPGCVYLQPPGNRSATRRQLQFDISFETDRNVFPSSHHVTGLCEPVPPADQKTCTMKGEESPNSSAEGSCLKALGGATAGSTDSEGPIVHRVMHLSGYNYGVPQTYVRPSCTEKDGTWTDSDKIRVCVRKRPLGLREERRGEVSVVTVEDKETIAIYEKKEAVNLKEYILQHVFYFDEVFSETFTNQDVYMRTAHPLIRHVFNGGNATCFAYGQTGAGKTYTMIGTPKNPGLYALAAKDIFQQLETNQQKKDHSVWISFYEIYCGQLYDLLNGRKRLYAREDGKHVVQVVGLREVQVKSVDFLLEVILKGSRERSTGATGVNSDSSRSHAVIQIQIKDVGNRKLGRMSFIDLAGSERASDARESDKQTKMEGAEINQSLLALKECIRALDQEQAHTPFRQSKLTQVLKDSFIGNSKTCMIANISPSHIATEHTLNTLRYADSGVDSDSFKLPLSDNELEHLKNRLMEYIFTHCGAKEKQTPKCVLIREDQTPRKTPASSGLLQSPCVSSQEAKMLEKAQQVVIQAHCKQLNEMSALSSQEEMLLNHTSSSDFQEYVKKLDEILTLKCKQIENLRAQLQKFLDQKPTEFMALDDCVCCS
ncbi:kinesin-like protein KIF24 isoform X2 [Bufo bufo]|uniref:kinesin-like protein KIF24 isoform X2 n=1 Tax=Bufo bufo TaxID=8384 RepID=UPI001ABEE4C3|nr:kinesin-like protein KIF24 isoform X2 [Bufo bufo]